MKKSGHLTDDQITKLFENLDEEHPDEDATKLLASLLTADEAVGNDVIFKTVKGRAKAEALDPIDAMLKTFVPKLSADQKKEYDKFGANDSHKKYAFMLKAFDELGTKSGDKNYNDLQQEFTDLKTKIQNGDYVEKSVYETEKSAATTARQQAVHMSLLAKAIRNGKLRDVTSDRHFERNFVADAEELLKNGVGEKKLKGVIDYATGQIMRADSTEQPLLVDGKSVTLDTLADLTITQYDWAKKSDPTPKGGVITADDSAKAGMSAAQRRNLQMDKGDA
ncbi:hypothetical protein GCM10027347_44660 [Larkinella harenae]